LKLSIDTQDIFPAVGRALMGHGAFRGTGAHRKLAFLEGLVEMTRPFLVIMGLPTAGIGAVLAPAALPSPPVLLLGMIAVALGVSATHSFNDWVDRRRDRTVWADRPIPAGRVPSNFALVYSALLAAGSLAITLAAFGTAAFAVLLIAESLATFYCLVLRDTIGYLSLPPIIALFPVGGWAAISPETLFTSPMPWFLAGIVLTWQTAHIMVYMPAHPISVVKGRPRCEKKALLFYPTPVQAAVLGVIFSAFLLAEAVTLGVVASLGVIYWVLAAPIAAITLLCALRLPTSSSDKGRAILAFNAASMALAFICGGACLDVIVRLRLDGFISWTANAAKDTAAWLETQASGVSSLAYWVVLVAAAFVALASVGKVLKELAQGSPCGEPPSAAPDATGD
jgi:4-hydroxybenzoate polyprenyltransferase